MQNKSPSTQRTNFSLRVVKTDDNIEIRARRKKTFGMQQTAMPKIVTKRKPQYAADKLWFEDCKDEQQRQGSC